MHSRLIAAAVAAVLAAAAAAHAATNVYRWVDKEGKVHFSDVPPPPGDVKDVSEKPMGGAAVEDSNVPYATRIAQRRHPVTLYTASDCGAPCDRGRDLLSSRGVPFTEKNAVASNADLEALRKLTGGSGEVPFLLVGETKIKGYDEDTWNSALDGAGYPRTRLPGEPVASGAAPAPAAAPAPPAPAKPVAQAR